MNTLNKIINNIKQSTNTLKSQNIQILLLIDCVLLPLALYTSVLLRLGGVWDARLNPHYWLFIVLPLIAIPIFIYTGLYRAVIRYIDDKVVVIVLKGVSISVLCLTLIIYIFGIYAFPKSSIIIFWVFALAYIGGTRLIIRGLSKRLDPTKKTNVIIYGAGSAGVQICIALQNGREYNPIAFIDDDTSKWGTMVRGIYIHSPKKLHRILEENDVNQILLAMPSISDSRRKKIITQLEHLSIHITTLPGISELINDEVGIKDIKEIEIEDLLGRDAIEANTNLMKHNIENKVILVTGAGGSIGSELVRQIIKLAPKKIILLEMSEFSLYNIMQNIQTHTNPIEIIDILGSITDTSLLHRIFRRYSIQTIFHAAAYKHVPIVEFNPIAGIKNNIFGTLNIAQCALKYNVDNMVLISTDKAVRPTNIMGSTKRIAEMILQAIQSQSKHTIFTMVRFGNVLGSSGSVVPLFREQIKVGGPVTVTHPDIIRYFMTIPEAVQLVIQASNMAHGGEVFVLDMGKPVKIFDLATQMIRLSGLTIRDENQPNGDIEIKFTGLRPGEKLYEELLIGDNPEPTLHNRIMKARDDFLEYTDLINEISILEKHIQTYEIEKAIDIIKYLVKDYQPSTTKVDFYY